MNRLLPLIIITFLSFAATNILGQIDTRSLNQGDDYFDSYEFNKAIKKYQNVLEKDTLDHVLRNTALCYMYLKDNKKACAYFDLLVNRPAPLASDLLAYAESLKKAGDYSKALIYFSKYRELNPLDLRARNHAVDKYYFESLAINKNNPVFYSLEVNDKGSILGFTAYEDKLIFSKGNNSGSLDFMDAPEVFLDMFYGKLDEKKKFGKIRYMPHHINSDFHDGPSSYNEKTKTLAYTRSSRFMKDLVEHTGQLEILFADYLGNDEWSEPVPFQYNSTEYSVGHPTISPNGTKLYFVSDKPGGFGGTDIYMCKKRGAEWTEPINLGPEVNTEADEMFPFVTYGDVLFFASSGHAGLGGLDIFKTYPFEDYWVAPENLGSPVNSRADDFGLMLLNKEEALLISDRAGGAGSDDVYYVNMEKTKDFFSIPADLLANRNLSNIKLTNLMTEEIKEFKPGVTPFLELDLKEGGYRISWLHKGKQKEIVITGKANKAGELDVMLKGLEGLKLDDFLSKVEVLVDSYESTKVRIDQKVWTYQKANDFNETGSLIRDIPDYARGKDNVIFMENGVAQATVTYPIPKLNDSSKLLFLTATAEESFQRALPELEKLIKAYDVESGVSLQINTLGYNSITNAEMLKLAQLIKEYVIKMGVPKHLTAVNPPTPTVFTSSEFNNYQILISANAKSFNE